MASRAHRWPGDNTPLTGVHGGTANKARAAVAEAKLTSAASQAKRIQWEWAKECAARIIERDLARTQSGRKDRMRPRVELGRQRVLADIVWDECNGICVYCGTRMLRFGGNDPLGFTLDHIIPKSRGGSNALDNLAGAHKCCNNEKGSLTGVEYRAALKSRA